MYASMSHIAEMRAMNKIINGLYLGNFSAANDIDSLQRSGVTHVLTVAEALTP